MQIEIGLDCLDVLVNHSSMSWGDVEIKLSDEVKDKLSHLYSSIDSCKGRRLEELTPEQMSKILKGYSPSGIWEGKLYETSNEGSYTTASVSTEHDKESTLEE